MRKVVVNVWMTLDGVVQAPGYKDEDPTGGFEHGGWHMRYFDDMSLGGSRRLRRGRWVSVWTPHLREFGVLLAERGGGGAGYRAAAEYVAEVRGIDDARRALEVAELDVAPGRHRRGRRLAEAGGRQGHSSRRGAASWRRC